MDFSLVLPELECSLSPQAYERLISIIKECKEDSKDLGKVSKNKSHVQRSKTFFPKITSWNQSTRELQKRPQNAPCFRILRRIILPRAANNGSLRTDSRTSSLNVTTTSRAEHDENATVIDGLKSVVRSPLESIIGKIGNPKITTSNLPQRKLKIQFEKQQIKNFNNQNSNPLYKDYNPQGYIPTDDELGEILVSQLVNDFNNWLDSIPGNPETKLDVNQIHYILRHELDIPTQSERLKLEKILSL